MDTTLTFEQAAAIVGHGLTLGLFDRQDVIAWADKWIAALPTPPYWLLELATSRFADNWETAKLLEKNVPPVKSQLEGSALLGIVEGVEDPANSRKLATIINRLLRNLHDGQWTPELRHDFYYLDEQYELFDQGCLPQASEASLRQCVKDFFATYALVSAAKALSPLRIRLKS